MSEQQWALILGASSGFGEATVLELAALGMNIFGVHLDRRETLPHAQEVLEKIRALGREAVAIRADHRAGVNGDAVADAGASVNDYVREKANILADLAIARDVVAAHENGARAQPDPGAQYAARANVSCRINFCRGGNDRARRLRQLHGH